MPPTRIGVIGLGYIATRAHLPGLQPLVDSGEAVFHAFCDINPETAEKAADEFKAASFYTDHHEMIDREEIDALFLLVPPSFHTDEELLAAEKGIPILIEKPQTLDISQAARYEKAIRESGIISTVGFMSRYYPAAQVMRERLAELTPRHANLQFFFSGTPIRHWTNRMELCGGTYVENSIHMIDLLRYMLGDDYESVSAFYYNRPYDPDPMSINLPHVYNANYRMSSGVVANATMSRVLTNTTASRHETIIVCDDVLLEYSHEKILENGEVIWEAEERASPFDLQAKAFIEAVRANDPSKVRNSYSTALNSLAAVLGANASAEKDGEVIRLEEFMMSET